MKLNREVYFNDWFLLLSCAILGYASTFFQQEAHVPLWVFMVSVSSLLILILLLWKYKVLDYSGPPLEVSPFLKAQNGKLIFEKNDSFQVQDFVSIYIEDGSSIPIGLGYVDSIMSKTKHLQVVPIVDFKMPSLLEDRYDLDAKKHVTFIKRTIKFDVIKTLIQKVEQEYDN
jgi:hypothetical protein